DLKRNLFKIDVRAQKDEEKVFMRTAWDWYLNTCFLNHFSVSLIMILNRSLVKRLTVWRA
uniref:hypothetical protein n=1 Tax=Streptococcus dysgalactiae TaxID=1334 RepID=UPI001F1E5153